MSWLRAHARGPVGAVFAIALCSGLAWALLTPAFEVPDEPGHYAYTEFLARTGKLPGGARPSYSDEQVQAITSLDLLGIRGTPYERAPTGGALTHDHPDRSNGGGPTGSTSQPPLFYAAEAVPYWAFSWGSVSTRLIAMRLLSVLFFASTAAVVALIASELVPGRPWVPLVAGASVALSPAMSAIAGGDTPDNLLDLLAALTVLLSIGALRRPTARAAVLVAGVASLGIMTKLTYGALLPGAVLVVVLTSWRVARSEGRTAALRAVAQAAAVGLALPLVWLVWTHLSGRGVVGNSASTPTLPTDQVRVNFYGEQLSYTWQLFFPRLPGMSLQFPHAFPLVNTWVDGFMGRFGWLDYGAPRWLQAVGRDVLAVLLVLALVGLWRARAAVRRQWLTCVFFAVLAVGLAYIIGSAGYDYRNSTGQPFEQVRYLFPLAAIFATAVAVACTAVGRRLAPVLAGVLVVAFLVHDLSGLLLTAGRYYG